MSSRRFVEEFIPLLRAEGRFAPPSSDMTIQQARKMISDDAFSCFFVQSEYQQRLINWHIQRGTEDVKILIKQLIPSLEPQYKACLVSALRKIILESDQSFGISPARPLKDYHGVFDMILVRDFIMGNWSQVGEVAWEIQRKKAQHHLRLKELKRKAEEDSRYSAMTEQRASSVLE